MSLDQKASEWLESYDATSDHEHMRDALSAVLDLHEPINVHLTIPGTEELLETPHHAICRECSDLDTAAALEFGDLVDASSGVRYPCKTVTAMAKALGLSGEDNR